MAEARLAAADVGLPGPNQSRSLRVASDRLRAQIRALGEIGRDSRGGLTRPSYSTADSEARRFFLGLCAEAGLSAETDGIGNIIMHAPGDDGSTSPVWSGSHLDAVPNGGHLDGALGSLAALECLRVISEAGLELHRPVRAVVFADEEGAYDHLLGSTALRKNLTRPRLEELTDQDGVALVDRLVEAGFDLDAAIRTRLEPDSIDSFVELHVEQGPVLEAKQIEIGVVTSIVGLGGARLEFVGQADHAGTTPMHRRKDALHAAAEYLTRLPALVLDIDQDAVVTCGQISVEPAGSNVVPGVARLTLDFRATSLDVLRRIAAALEAEAQQVASRLGLVALWHGEDLVHPVDLDAGVREVIVGAADELGLTSMEIASGAGHDAQNMAHLAPSAMVFVPSIDGKSHSPAEDTHWTDIENGANVLLHTLIVLATR